MKLMHRNQEQQAFFHLVLAELKTFHEYHDTLLQCGGTLVYRKYIQSWLQHIFTENLPLLISEI